MGPKASYLVRCSMARYRRAKPQKPGDEYRKIWRLVDGGITDCFNHHPGYLPQGKAKISSLRRSLLKRITGSILSSAADVAKRRSRDPWAAKIASAGYLTAGADGACEGPVAAGPRCRGAGLVVNDPAPYDWMQDFGASYDLAIAAMRREGLITGRFEPQSHADYLETLRS